MQVELYAEDEKRSFEISLAMMNKFIDDEWIPKRGSKRNHQGVGRPIAHMHGPPLGWADVLDCAARTKEACAPELGPPLGSPFRREPDQAL